MTGYRCYSFRIFNLCFVMLDGKAGTGSAAVASADKKSRHPAKSPAVLRMICRILSNRGILTAQVTNFYASAKR